MEINRNGSRESRPSDPDHFTGKAWVDQDFSAPAPRVFAAGS